ELGVEPDDLTLAVEGGGRDRRRVEDPSHRSDDVDDTTARVGERLETEGIRGVIAHGPVVGPGRGSPEDSGGSTQRRDPSVPYPPPTLTHWAPCRCRRPASSSRAAPIRT